MFAMRLHACGEKQRRTVLEVIRQRWTAKVRRMCQIVPLVIQCHRLPWHHVGRQKNYGNTLSHDDSHWERVLEKSYATFISTWQLARNLIALLTFGRLSDPLIFCYYSPTKPALLSSPRLSYHAFACKPLLCHGIYRSAISKTMLHCIVSNKFLTSASSAAHLIVDSAVSITSTATEEALERSIVSTSAFTIYDWLISHKECFWHFGGNRIYLLPSSAIRCSSSSYLQCI